MRPAPHRSSARLVLGEAVRVALVVEEAALGELLHGRLDGAWVDPLALEEGPQLGDGALARGERLVGQVDGPCVVCVCR